MAIRDELDIVPHTLRALEESHAYQTLEAERRTLMTTLVNKVLLMAGLAGLTAAAGTVLKQLHEEKEPWKGKQL